MLCSVLEQVSTFPLSSSGKKYIREALKCLSFTCQSSDLFIAHQLLIQFHSHWVIIISTLVYSRSWDCDSLLVGVVLSFCFHFFDLSSRTSHPVSHLHPNKRNTRHKIRAWVTLFLSSHAFVSCPRGTLFPPPSIGFVPLFKSACSCDSWMCHRHPLVCPVYFHLFSKAQYVSFVQSLETTTTCDEEIYSSYFFQAVSCLLLLTRQEIS